MNQPSSHITRTARIIPPSQLTIQPGESLAERLGLSPETRLIDSGITGPMTIRGGCKKVNAIPPSIGDLNWYEERADYFLHAGLSGHTFCSHAGKPLIDKHQFHDQLAEKLASLPDANKAADLLIDAERRNPGSSDAILGPDGLRNYAWALFFKIQRDYLDIDRPPF